MRIVLFVCGYRSHWQHYATTINATALPPARGRR
jgi:hypothetical protein